MQEALRCYGFYNVSFQTGRGKATSLDWIRSHSPKPLPMKKAKTQPSSVSGPRCVARFEFEGEHNDELSFSEGDVIQLKEYVADDWARGQIGMSVGIFPLNFVEIIEDLPPSPNQQSAARIALPGEETCLSFSQSAGLATIV
ncbi:hypothetical protein XENOCAPTIV_023236 [Xenoophorus captivus]|uniref:SH3 domain-containing protein n=1 Tax=Xenoophorus captivus TaxID=1517983 RepID=A0ABV0RVY5_9TELE